MFRREIEKELENYLECKQAIIILGARQVGKTTLLKRLIEKFPKQKTYYFDLE
ncbi:MAG: AAA family ATPase, partial [Candidatus Marinimicrobia bacterium]|nr:AAA family ATPase [Candidatus Neomarinimicrobiota bacterium]